MTKVAINDDGGGRGSRANSSCAPDVSGARAARCVGALGIHSRGIPLISTDSKFSHRIVYTSSVGFRRLLD